MSISASDNALASGKLFADDYFGPTEKVEHKLPVFSQGDTPSFKDVIDTINPLQHIPVISTIYRELTGDEPGAVARIAGGALYGGPIGLVGELINSAIDDNTGKDVGGHMMAALKEEFSDPSTDPSQPAPTAVAVATPPAPAPAPAAESPPPPPPAATVAAAEPPPPQAAPQAAVESTPVPPPAPAPETTASAAPVPASAPATTPEALPSYLTMQQPRVMPAPQRRAVSPVPVPMLHANISTSGQRSNAPSPGAGLRSVGAQAALAAETAPAAQSAQAASATSLDQQWFSAAMMQALDKYERANRPNQAGSGTSELH